MGVPERTFHHLDIRKRIHKKHEKYPSPDKLKRNIDRLVYASVIIIPLLNIHQIYKIWIYQDASGVSVITWFGFAVFAVVWLIYGIIHKEKPLIFLNIGLIITQVLIAIGALIYG